MKQKTRKWAAKRFSVTASGKVKYGKVAKRHLLSNKSSKAKWRNKYGAISPKWDTLKVEKALNI